MPKTKKKSVINGEDVDKAVESIFKEILMPYQRQWIIDNSRFKICNKSRQIGVSEAITLEGLLDVLYKSENVFFVSRSLRQSVELLDKFNKWLSVFRDLGINLRKEIDSRTEIKLNGCNIKSLTSNAVTGEGFTGNVYLDEFALHKDDQQIYKSIFPTATLGYNIRIVSRPFGQSNMFYKIFTRYNNKYKGYSRHQVDIYQAIQQGWQVNLDELKENYDEEGFQENYECLFLDESTAYFTYELLKNCINDIDSTVTGKRFMGIDIGRSNDATAVTVLAQDARNNYHLIDYKEIKNKPFAEQRFLISELINKHDPASVFADKSSVGYQLVEDLERDFKCVHGKIMSNVLKMEAFTSLKKKFEEHTIFIPDDIDLLNQLHSIKREFSTGGTVKFSAERTSKGHADLAFSLALAIHSTAQTKKIISNPVLLITGK